MIFFPLSLLLLLHLHISLSLSRFVPSWAQRLGGRNEREEEGLCDCTPRDHPHNTRYLGVHKKTMGLSLSLSFSFILPLYSQLFLLATSSSNSIKVPYWNYRLPIWLSRRRRWWHSNNKEDRPLLKFKPLAIHFVSTSTMKEMPQWWPIKNRNNTREKRDKPRQQKTTWKKRRRSIIIIIWSRKIIPGLISF